MGTGKGTRVLAVGLDAAEASLVRRMMGEGELPVMSGLLERGKWARLESPSRVGSGAVWPTFLTGTDARAHGVYGEWCWQPETMGLARYGAGTLEPFWRSLARAGTSVGAFDVPFTTAAGAPRGFEVSEWGAHDTLEGRTRVSPESLSEVVGGTKPHPFSLGHMDAAGPDDRRRLSAVSDACLRGAELRGELASRLLSETRPELAVVAFTEIHHVSHYLWHTVAPEHALYADGAGRDSLDVTPGVRDVYRAVDAQIARLLSAVGGDALVVVFALHGMRPTRGVPAFLEPLMIETGWARLSGWATQTWRERALTLFAAAKRRAPAGLKNLYYKTVPRAATYQLAQTTMLPSYDWPRTRAFSLPTDQHGWIRVNLAGRESRGVVPAGEYEETCRRIEEMLRGVVDEEGRPLVRGVMRTARDAEDASESRLPDLVVHYHDAAHADALRVRGRNFTARPLGGKFTGQHDVDGFLLASGGRAGLIPGDTVSASDLGRLITSALDGAA